MSDWDMAVGLMMPAVAAAGCQENKASPSSCRSACRVGVRRVACRVVARWQVEVGRWRAEAAVAGCAGCFSDTP